MEKSGMLVRAIALARRIFSVETRRRIVKWTRWPPVGLVRFGNLRRLRPISTQWGLERGQPIDRYYIERFLEQWSDDIHGRVLEIGDDLYTARFGGSKVSSSEILHVAEQKDKVTLIGDLTRPEQFAPDSFDCVILTQTLQTIYDVPAAVRTIRRILKPEGVALVTTAGISKISRYDMDRWGYYWSFTTKSIQRLFEGEFPPENLTVDASGNVLTAIAFLHGLAAEELTKKELELRDPDYELLITMRAQKSAGVQ